MFNQAAKIMENVNIAMYIKTMVEYVVYFVYFVYSVYFVYFGMVEYSTFCTFCIAMYIELWQNIVHFVLYNDLFKLSFTSPHHLTNILFF